MISCLLRPCFKFCMLPYSLCQFVVPLIMDEISCLCVKTYAIKSKFFCSSVLFVEERERERVLFFLYLLPVWCLSALQLCLLGLGGCVVLLACSVIGESADDRGMLVFYAIQQAKTNSRRRGRGSSGVSGCTRCAFSWISTHGFCEHCFVVHFLWFRSYSVAYLIIVWSILLKTERMCSVKMLNSVMLTETLRSFEELY